MKTISKVMIFDDDQQLLLMLKGYCYANNIQMIKSEFHLDRINEIEKLNPDLILIPLERISNLALVSIEAGVLRLACKSKDIKIFGLNRNENGILPAKVPEWIDTIIHNPLDISEIDRFVKTSFLCGSYLPERRTHQDRRKIPDRRQSEFINHGYPGNNEMEANNSDALHHKTGGSGPTEFHVDSRNKCLFLKGQKIDLTPKEFELIELLSTDPDRIFTPDEIIKHLWPENHRATKSDLYQYIHLLRKKIEKDHNQPQLIVNAKGFGYKLNVDFIPSRVQHVV